MKITKPENTCACSKSYNSILHWDAAKCCNFLKLRNLYLVSLKKEDIFILFYRNFNIIKAFYRNEFFSYGADNQITSLKIENDFEDEDDLIAFMYKFYDNLEFT